MWLFPIWRLKVPRVLTCGILCADIDEQSKKEIKDILIHYDRTLLVADPRRCEPKKWVSSPSSSYFLHPAGGLGVDGYVLFFYKTLLVRVLCTTY